MSNIQGSGGGGGGCWATYARIRTPNGLVCANELNIGDLVCSFDEKGVIHNKKITAIFKHDDEDVYEYYLWGKSNPLPMTPNHWVLNHYNAFVCISTMQLLQDCLVDIRGHLRHITDVRYIGKMPVLNFHIEDLGTLIVEDVRCHNGGIDHTLRNILGSGGGGGGGKGGGGSGGGQDFYEAPNTLQNNTTLYLLEAISAGTIEGLVDADKSIFINETPLKGSTGADNFKGVKWQFRDGSLDQNIIPGFENISTEVDVGIELKQDTPLVRRIDSVGADAVVVRISVPQLANNNTSSNQLVGTSVQLGIDVSTNGGAFIEKMTPTISGKSSSYYAKSFRVDLHGNPPWDIRVRRITPDATVSTLYNKTTWDGFSIKFADKLSYPGVALMGYTVDAKEFGNSVPSRATEMKGILVDVPSNYNPITREYNGLWDGTFKTAWSDNPAWFLWYIITDKDNGAGEWIPDWSTSFTKIELYEMARYCDELVDDGYGGKEPRFTFNYWIVDRQKVFDYLYLIAGAFRAQTFWGAGCVGISQDRPRDMSRIFSPANVISGKFTYSETPLTSLFSVAQVSWNDPSDFYKPCVELYEDAEFIQKIGYRVKSINLIGCTSRGQAYRAGAFIVFTSKMESNTVTFKVGIDNCDIMPGEIAGIVDPNLMGVEYGGRVKSIVDKTATLDRPINFLENKTYRLCVIQKDGSLETVDITNPAEKTDIVTLITPFSKEVLRGAMWVLFASNIEPALFRIMGIAEETPTEYSLIGVQYNKYKYDFIEKGFSLPDRPSSLLPTGDLPPPTNINHIEFIQKYGDTVVSSFTVSWSPPDPMDSRIALYELHIKTPEEDIWKLVTITSSVDADIVDTLTGVYSVRVRCVSTMGAYSEWVTSDLDIIAQKVDISSVTNFAVVVDNPVGLNFTWNPVNTVGITGYTITSPFFTKTTSNTYLNTNDIIGQTGELTFSIVANHAFGTVSRIPTVATVEIINPKQPIVTSFIKTDGLFLTWQDCQATWDIKEYIITDMYNGTAHRTRSEQYDVPPRPFGEYIFKVQAVDIYNNTSSVATINVDIESVDAPNVSLATIGGVLRLSWDIPVSAFPIKSYEVCDSVGSLIHTTQSTFYDIPPDAENTAGVLSYNVRAVDSANNRTSFNVFSQALVKPQAPNVIVVISPDQKGTIITWTMPNSEVPINAYDVVHQYEKTLSNGLVEVYENDLGRFDTTTCSTVALSADVDNSKHFFMVRAVNYMEMTGEWGENKILITKPSKVLLNGRSIDNNVFLDWLVPVEQMYAIKEYLIYRQEGTDIEDRLFEEQGRIDSQFFSLFENKGGTYTYKVIPVDWAGTLGEGNSISIVVDEPPDFILFSDYDSTFNGSKDGFVLVGNGSMLAGVYPNETWSENIVRTGLGANIEWQDKVDNDMGYFCSPYRAESTYIEIVDIGTTVAGTKITVSPTYVKLEGVCELRCKIEISNDNVNWTTVLENGLEVYAIQFRYVRYTIKILNGMANFTNINYRLDLKQKSDNGVVSYLASMGTTGVWVTFTTNFTDVKGIPMCTVNESSFSNPLTAYVDFEDVLRPTGFYVFVLDKNGNPANGTVTWQVNGV